MNKNGGAHAPMDIEGEVPAGQFLGQPLYPSVAQMMAVTTTADYTTRYLAQRVHEGDRTSGHTMAFFGLGRLQMLVDEGMQQIADLFTGAEWLMLQNVFPGYVFDVPSITYLFSDFCDHFGWEGDDAIPAELRPLATKLQKLTLFQRWVVADAIERFWQFTVRNSGRDVYLGEAASEIGLKLRGQ